MPKPDASWLEALPRTRCLAEFSLWSANLIGLEADLLRVGDLVDIYHIDVADGVFAPSLLFFPDIVAALRKKTAIPFHVHLMCADAVLLAQVDQFAEAGADMISVHVENGNAAEALARITALGLKEGGVDVAMDEHNARLVTVDMKARVDAARSDIVSGKLSVVDFTVANSCR